MQLITTPPGEKEAVLSPQSILITNIINTEANDDIRLWKAVLLQALIDVKNKVSSTFSAAKKREAIEFFTDKDSDLDYICFTADVDAGRYRKYGLSLISGLSPVNDNGEVSNG